MVTTIKKILFTTDLSDGAMDVYKEAIRLASSCQASLIILHVIEEVTSQPKNLVTDILGKETYAKLEQENEAYVQNIMLGKRKEAPIIEQTLVKMAEKSGTVADGKPVEIDATLVTMGHIADEIVSQAESNNCDIIVMGYHIKSIIAELMLGRKTKRVIRNTKIPVYLVPVRG
jgi:nucleotide-binding universal stress UspA family protein